MRSMLADQPYWEVTTMAGDLARRLLTLTPVTLEPSASFHQAIRSLNLSCQPGSISAAWGASHLGEDMQLGGYSAEADITLTLLQAACLPSLPSSHEGLGSGRDGYSWM